MKIAALFAAWIMMAGMLLSGASAEGTEAVYSLENLFTSRDLTQEADLTEAERYTLQSGEELQITSAGVYVLTGTASDATVYVEAGKEDNVQLVLDGLNVVNADFPVIYVKSGNKVFITVSADSSLSVTGTFRADGSTNTDGVIFSKSDLVLGGTAALTISSTNNGIVSKDDLKVTGGTWNINAASKALEANDSIRIADGTLNLVAGTDGLHAENSDDASLGYVYIAAGTLTIQAGDDGIHGTSVVQIDGGTLSISAAEGIEGTYIQLNGGTVSIQASDDGINAARKSSAYSPTVVINGGDISVTMASGDTDGIDSNGDIIVNGGTVSVNGNSTFDCDGSAQYNGGVIITNGQQVASIPNSMFGGRGNQGGWGGQSNWGSQGGWGGRGGR